MEFMGENMKAFKGCTNPKCKEYKKTHFKSEDEYCPKCGDHLYYVCTECWAKLDSNIDRHCSNCKAIKQYKRSQLEQKFMNQVVKSPGYLLEGLKFIIATAAVLKKERKI